MSPMPTPPSGARILLAEDNVINQKVALIHLRKLGYPADMASTGREAVAAAAAYDYDLILMDCEMPDMDGFEATREIRRREEGGRRTPILAMTASIQSSDRRKCIEAGMDGDVAKPIRPEELRDVLARWLGPAEGV